MPLIAPYVPPRHGGAIAAAITKTTASLTAAQPALMITSTLTRPKFALSGTQQQSGVVGVTLVEPTAALSKDQPVSTIAGTLTIPAAALAGTPQQSGVMGATVAKATTTLTGVQQPEGTIAATAPKLTTSATGLMGIFVTRDASNGNLMLNGQRFRFGGANVPFMGVCDNPSNYGATVQSDGNHWASHSEIDASLDSAVAFNSWVITVYGAVQSTGKVSSVQPSLGVFQAAALEPFDYVLKRCNELGIKCIVNLVGNYDFPAEGYKFWYCTANGLAANDTNFYTNTTVINSLKAHITFVLNHVNVYTGVAYKNDPAMLAWGTGGEMTPWTEPTASTWTDTISRHIKQTLGAQQLVIDGMCSLWTDGQDGTVAVDRLALPYVDIYQTHTYSHFSPPRYHHDGGKICHQAGKAYIVGEYPWQGVEPDTFTATVWTLTELLSVSRGSPYVDGLQMWEILAPLVTFGGGYTLHWPTPDNSSGKTIPVELARGRQMAYNGDAMSHGPVKPSRLVGVRAGGITYSGAAYRGGSFNDEGCTDYVAQENDVVLAFGGSVGVTAVANAPTGWVNPLGANVGVSSASHTLACMYHQVTAAEAAANNVSYVVTNMFGAGANGDGAFIAIRGIDPNTVIDAINTASGTASTTHVLPSLSGASLSTDSLVISCVSSPSTNTYTVPVGTGQAGISNGTQGIWLGVYDDYTTTGVTVAAKNVTASASTAYASITLALTGFIPPPPVPTLFPPVSRRSRPNYGALIQL